MGGVVWDFGIVASSEDGGKVSSDMVVVVGIGASRYVEATGEFLLGGLYKKLNLIDLANSVTYKLCKSKPIALY